jgi:hypothetical protein
MKKILIFSLFTAALAVACSKDSGTTPSTSKQDNFRLCAVAGQMTKTEICGCQDIQWISGDKLSVWEDGNALNSNVQFSLTPESAGKTTGDFTGTLTPAGPDFTLYSIYPYKDSYGNDPTAVTLTIPAVINQCSDVNDLVGDMDFMLGRCSSAQYDSGSGSYRMLFRHPLAFIQLRIDGRNCVYREATLQTLTMTADVAFVGNVTADLSAGTITSAAVGEEGKSLVINFPATARMSDVQDAWIAINPVDLTDANCHFILEMTNGQKVDFKVNPKSMVEQSLYKFEFSDIDTKIANNKGTPTYVDLIAFAGGERANCYIISEGGYYRFAAQRVDKSNCFTGTQPYTDGYRADWLWATGTASNVTGVGIGNSGNINFRVEPASNGNTIIALYNSSNEIQWSWHIWCTTEDPTTPTHYGRNDAWLMIDRNLGATSNVQGDVASYGLMYQWGRKDPFPGPKTAGSLATSKESVAWTDLTEDYVFNPTAPVSAFSTTRNSNTSAVGDIAYSIANPTTNIHHYAKNGTTALGNTWLYTTPEADALKLWNSDGSRNGKTNYDPCPPGYLVPVTNAYAWYTTWVNNVDFETNVNLSGVVLYENASNTSYYPAVGYRASGQISNTGYGAYYPAANSKADGGNLIVYSLQYYNRTNKSNGAKLQTQWALPVRCMKK